MLQTIKARLLVILAAVGVATLAVHQKGLALGHNLVDGTLTTLDPQGSEETHPDERRDELIRRAERVVRSRVEERIAEAPRFQRVGSARQISERPGPVWDRAAEPDHRRTVRTPEPSVAQSPPRIGRVLDDAHSRRESAPQWSGWQRSDHAWTTHGPTAGRPPPVR